MTLYTVYLMRYNIYGTTQYRKYYTFTFDTVTLFKVYPDTYLFKALRHYFTSKNRYHFSHNKNYCIKVSPSELNVLKKLRFTSLYTNYKLHKQYVNDKLTREEYWKQLKTSVLTEITLKRLSR